MKTPKGKNLRKARFSGTNQIYLITTTTHQRIPLFEDFNCARFVVHAISHEDCQAETLAYVVMPDHFHWLMQINEGGKLDKVMQSIKSASSHHINKFHNRKGPVWQSGYHDHALREEEDLKATARYVVANPLRAGLVERVGDYPLWDASWL